MKRNLTFTTAILLPIITTLVAYIALYGYFYSPAYGLSKKRWLDYKNHLVIRKSKKITEKPIYIKPFGLAMNELTQVQYTKLPPISPESVK